MKIILENLERELRKLGGA